MKISLSLPYGFSGEYVPPYAENSQELENFVSKHKPNSKIFRTFKGVVLYTFLENKKTFIFAEREGRLIYCVTLSKFLVPSKFENILGKRIVSQASVWRNQEIIRYSENFSAEVFWEILLSDKRCIATDSSQSRDGRFFWFKRISEALNKKYKVFGCDFDVGLAQITISSLVPILDLDQVKDFYSSKESTSGYFKRIIITKFK